MCISVEVSNMKTSGNVEHLNTFSVRWFLTFYLPLCGKRIYLYKIDAHQLYALQQRKTQWIPKNRNNRIESSTAKS